MEIRVALQKFQTAKRSIGRSSETVDWYGYMLSAFDRWLIEANYSQAVADVTPDVIDEFLAARRAAGDADRTVAGYYRALSSFFGWLLERKLVPVSPLAVLRAPAVVKKPPRQADLADLRDMLGRIQSDTWLDLRDRLIIRLLFITGIRISEATALDIQDIDLRGAEIYIRRGKGGKPRYVPMRQPLPTDTLTYLVNRPAALSPALLLSANGDGGVKGRLTPGGVRTMLRRRAEETGTPYWNPHSYRHAAAMDMLNEGKLPMDFIAKIFGHSSPEITRQVYADWTRESVQNAYKEAAERMSNI